MANGTEEAEGDTEEGSSKKRKVCYELQSNRLDANYFVL